MTRHPLRTLLAASLFGLALTSPPLVAAEPHQATPAFAASSLISPTLRPLGQFTE